MFTFGTSLLMNRLKEMALVLAGTAQPLLILGEEGTDKEQLARFIHLHSARDNRPFMKLDLSLLGNLFMPSALAGIRRELIHFSPKTASAGERRPGGTLYLENIDRQTTEIQARILSFLENRNSKVMVIPDALANVRIIAGASPFIERAVNEGRFRADLYYRLAGFTIEIPPLRSRREDIGAILMDLLRHDPTSSGRGKRLSAETVSMLTLYDWPGNVAELRDFITRGLEACGEENEFDRKIQSLFCIEKLKNNRSHAEESLKDISREWVEKFESMLILRTLQQCRWNRVNAAKILQISYRSLLYKMKKYNISNSLNARRLSADNREVLR